MPRRILDVHDPPPSPPPLSNDVRPSILITILILSVAVLISATLYLIVRFVRRNHHHTNTASRTQHHSLSAHNKITPLTNDPLISTLPLFTFDSLSSTVGDCAVCLSKFESRDLLRLLPLCCHAFHADCIDTWLHSNQSCPLCRSPVFLSESELISKFEPTNPARISSSGSSFRVEIGNVSQRNGNELRNDPSVRRSYSLGGNFDYILDDDVVSVVHSGSFKVDDEEQQRQQESDLTGEIGTRGGGGWLKEYLSHSFSTSFRSSGRWFFTGSSRRENVDGNNNSNSNNRVTELDMEASRLGDDIGELFRWLSGV